jgi:hypothetical protein
MFIRAREKIGVISVHLLEPGGHIRGYGGVGMTQMGFGVHIIYGGAEKLCGCFHGRSCVVAALSHDDRAG